MSTTVGGMGEFALIAAVTARLTQGPQVLVGPGDDAAVVDVARGAVVATTDLLVEGRHFRLDWSRPYDVGRKAAAANLADIAAMGARPVALLVGLAMPARLRAEDALALTDGLNDECAETGASLVGGDVVGADTLLVAGTALGALDGRPPVTRGGARTGDVVALAGRLGWSAAGLALLSAGVDPGADLETDLGADLGTTDPATEVVAAHRRPSPPYAAGVEAAVAGARAMCDVSDGLLQDAGHLAAASGVGIELDPAALPLDPPLARAAELLGVDPLHWALGGGEDHALLACFPPTAALPPGWRRIGAAVPGRGVRAGGRETRLVRGWDHFR